MVELELLLHGEEEWGCRGRLARSGGGCRAGELVVKEGLGASGGWGKE